MKNQKETGNRQRETGNRKPEIGERVRMRVGGDIAERLLTFAVLVGRLSRLLPRDVAGRHVSTQMLRSGTSAGANYEEARAAESRADFIHKVGVAAKEVRETLYWLSFVQGSGWTVTSLDGAIAEGEQLAAILSASIRTARSR
jgi:four helix bundle protein